MAEWGRAETLRANERIKHAATFLTAWGNALLIATLARIVVADSFDIFALLWLIGAAFLIWVSSRILGFLEPEPNDE